MEQSPDIDALACNCISGPAHIYENLLVIQRGKKAPFGYAQRGYPRLWRKDFYYTNAEYFVHNAKLRIPRRRYRRLLRHHSFHIAALKGRCSIRRDPRQKKKQTKKARRLEKVTNAFTKKLKTSLKSDRCGNKKPSARRGCSAMLNGASLVRKPGRLINIPDNLLRGEGNAQCLPRYKRE